METFTLKENEEFIELNNLMKVLHWVPSGGEAKVRIDAGEVKVNGEVETRRRKKMKSGDVAVFGKDSATIA
jgi:ribosome-associated protein